MTTTFTFFLGTHQPEWLSRSPYPLFVSRRRLFRKIKTKYPYLKFLPYARTSWALDSGGFSELTLHGHWTVTPQEYVKEVKRLELFTDKLLWAPVQDWMCEDQILKKTHQTVRQHQINTVQSYLDLKTLYPEFPWVPVLQGRENYHYLKHIELYEQHKVDLFKEKLVGIGSVCRRQHTEEATRLIKLLHLLGLRLHAFGFKTQGLRKTYENLTSSDSLSWAYDASRTKPLEGCTHVKCSNCYKYALLWRGRLLNKLGC